MCFRNIFILLGLASLGSFEKRQATLDMAGAADGAGNAEGVIGSALGGNGDFAATVSAAGKLGASRAGFGDWAKFEDVQLEGTSESNTKASGQLRAKTFAFGGEEGSGEMTGTVTDYFAGGNYTRNRQKSTKLGQVSDLGVGGNLFKDNDFFSKDGEIFTGKSKYYSGLGGDGDNKNGDDSGKSKYYSGFSSDLFNKNGDDTGKSKYYSGFSSNKNGDDTGKSKSKYYSGFNSDFFNKNEDDSKKSKYNNDFSNDDVFSRKDTDFDENP